MLNQSSRQIRVKTSLPEGALAFKAMRMSEGLSRLFEMQLEFYSDDPTIDFDAVLGRNVTVALDTQFGSERYFNGFLSRFSFAGSHGRRYVYQGVASPWLWFLTRTETCRIFHDQSADAIVAQIFREHGFTDFEFRLTRSYPTYEYCVQYRESDFAFVSRLMEREGIYYFFEHQNGLHQMIIVDAMSAHETEPGYERYEYFARDDFSERRREGVFGWRPEMIVQPTRFRLQDYDFKKPTIDLTTDAAIGRGHALSDMEIYEYPGFYRDPEEGRAYAKTRVEEMQARHMMVTGEGNVRGVKSGRIFTLEDHPNSSFNKEHLVVSATYQLTADDYETGGEDEETYFCTFSTLASKEVFRPERQTPKPVIVGPQTAMVVGEKEEEIDPDEHGRVKVLFHWERENKPSCWVRVSQSSAGSGFGAMSIPRIGQEVIVEFEEGDPDRPIITGRVYNALQRNPYDPPAKRNITTMRTNTVKGEGFNELRFDDTAGAEGVYLHAQYDFDRLVLNDSRDRVENDSHVIVEKNSFSEVRENAHRTVAMDDHVTVGDIRHVEVSSDDLRTVGGNIVDIADGQIHLESGASAVVEAKTGVTLKAGGSFITVLPSGIFINGPIVNINTGGSALSGPGLKAKPAEKPVEVKAHSGGEKDPRARARSGILRPDQIDQNPVAAALRRASQAGLAFCAHCKK